LPPLKEATVASEVVPWAISKTTPSLLAPPELVVPKRFPGGVEDDRRLRAVAVGAIERGESRERCGAMGDLENNAITAGAAFRRRSEEVAAWRRRSTALRDWRRWCR